MVKVQCDYAILSAISAYNFIIEMQNMYILQASRVSFNIFTKTVHFWYHFQYQEQSYSAKT